MEFLFSENAWREYLQWQIEDRRTIKKINDLLQDIARGGYEGIGKPEPLKGELSGYWSRRIDQKNRLVYQIDDEVCKIIQCCGHYD